MSCVEDGRIDQKISRAAFANVIALAAIFKKGHQIFWIALLDEPNSPYIRYSRDIVCNILHNAVIR